MRKIIAKINVKRRGLTNATLYEVMPYQHDHFLDGKGELHIGGSTMPDTEYVRFKIAKFLECEDFILELI